MSTNGEVKPRERLFRPRWRGLVRAVRLVWESAPGWAGANLALIAVQGLLPLAALSLTKLMIDAVSAGVSSPDRALAFRHALFYMGLAAAVALADALCRALGALVSTAQSQAVGDHMYDVLHAKSIEVDLAYYENNEFHDTLHRTQQQAPYRPPRIVAGLARLVQSTIAICAVGAVLFWVNTLVAIVLLAAAVPGVIVRIYFARREYRWLRKRTPNERWAEYFDWLLTDPSIAKELRLFGLGHFFLERFSAVRKVLRRERVELATRRMIAETFAQAGAIAAVFGSYAYVGYEAINGSISLGDLVMYFQAFHRGQGYLQDLLGSMASLFEDSLFLVDLDEFLNIPPQVVDTDRPKPVPRPLREGITLEDVHFRYPAGARDVLDGISLAIRPGEVVALVGENGSGKTTLIKLLCRLYDPTEGAICADGIDLRQMATADWRGQMSVIFQDYVHYHLTARENIGVGQTSRLGDQAAIVQAAEQAGAEELIGRLKQGYETILGRQFEEGQELSGGEWQKVALARAFLREAQLIVLDEPTSALDARAEYEVFQRFRSLVAGRSAILISHRFSTVRMADCIYVLEDGKIIEGGSHEELLRLGGRYAQLFALQAQSYQ